MASRVRPEVKITFDKERTFRLDLNAMITFEEATGKSLIDGTFKANKMSPKELRSMLWVILLHEDDSLTEKQVGSWVTVNNMVEVTTKLNEAFEVAMPEAKADVPLKEKRPSG